MLYGLERSFYAAAFAAILAFLPGCVLVQTLRAAGTHFLKMGTSLTGPAMTASSHIASSYQDYAGVPNSNRFPNYFSLDARFAKDFKVSPKYTVRLSPTGLNFTNHFNALAVHANTSDPLYGNFFGDYHRRYCGDSDIIF